MYKKIGDGFTTIDIEKKKDKELLQKKQLEEQPMSYFICPICDNPNLEKCSCSKGFLNYYCNKCQFKHINHHHKPSDTDKYKNNVDKLTLSKIIKK